VNSELSKLLVLGKYDFAYYALAQRRDLEIAPFHHIVINQLEAVERGEELRTMLLMPPRHGKDVDLENRVAELERQSTSMLQEQKLTSGQGREAGFEGDREVEGTICITESVITPADCGAATVSNSSEPEKAEAATDSENKSADVSTKKVAETETADVFEESELEETVDSDGNNDDEVGPAWRVSRWQHRRNQANANRNRRR
jgi:hypothetical protein